MARRESNIDDEKRSYSALFLLSVGLLLAGAVWSVWDDNISRRPWKYYQADFSEREQARVRNEDQEGGRPHLANDPTYQQVTKDLAAARQRLGSGETPSASPTSKRSAAAWPREHSDIDLSLRIVKSQLEEAWYDYDSAVLEKQPTEAIRAHIEQAQPGKGPHSAGLRRHQGADRSSRQGARARCVPR